MVAVLKANELRLPLIRGWGDLPIRVRLARRLGDDALFGFCQVHRELRIEQTAEGELIIIPPTGGETGRRNAELIRLLGNWSERNGTGVWFDSNTAFLLPNGAERSPDASWVRRSRWSQLTVRERERFPPLCPDFVAEIRSPTDSLPELQAKMEEYLVNGARLGWLFDPKQRQIWIYQPGEGAVRLDRPKEISGGRVLPRFRVSLARLW